MIIKKRYLSILDETNIKLYHIKIKLMENLGKWDISSEEDNLTFLFNGEKKMVLTKNGQLHVKDDIIYLAKMSNEALDNWDDYSKKRIEKSKI